MSSQTFVALCVFALVASCTPGPNTMMLLASGVNFGFYRTIPHMIGIMLGFAALLLSVGFGLGAVFEAFPVVKLILKITGAVYLVYLAWRIAMTRAMDKGETGGQPFSLIQAAAFQWVNPKAWIMAISAMAIYTTASAPTYTALLVVGAFLLVGIPSVMIWAGGGAMLRGWLAHPTRLKIFNLAMGGLLIASLYPVFIR